MSAAEDLMAKFTGAQKGGESYNEEQNAGRRRRKSHSGRKGNSWLAHVKATMKLHPGKSFKQVLKIAKKTYKRSQSQSSSQSGGKRRNGKSQKNHQNGGSGVAEYATAV
jgi:hypothetical protein